MNADLYRQINRAVWELRLEALSKNLFAIALGVELGYLQSIVAIYEHRRAIEYALHGVTPPSPRMPLR